MTKPSVWRILYFSAFTGSEFLCAGEKQAKRVETPKFLDEEACNPPKTEGILGQQAVWGLGPRV